MWSWWQLQPRWKRWRWTQDKVQRVRQVMRRSRPRSSARFAPSLRRTIFVHHTKDWGLKSLTTFILSALDNLMLTVSLQEGDVQEDEAILSWLIFLFFSQEERCRWPTTVSFPKKMFTIAMSSSQASYFAWLVKIKTVVNDSGVWAVVVKVESCNTIDAFLITLPFVGNKSSCLCLIGLPDNFRIKLVCISFWQLYSSISVTWSLYHNMIFISWSALMSIKSCNQYRSIRMFLPSSRSMM